MPTVEEIKKNIADFFREHDEKDQKKDQEGKVTASEPAEDEESKDEGLFEKAGRLAKQAKEAIVGSEKDQELEIAIHRLNNLLKTRAKQMGAEPAEDNEPKDNSLLEKAERVAHQAKEAIMGSQTDGKKDGTSA
eukprot:849948-Rhodomonas_salina.2